jgi:hypothetical protein
VLHQAATDAGLAPQVLAGGLRLRRRGRLQFAVNYGPATATAPAPADARFVLGTHRLPPVGVPAWRRGGVVERMSARHRTIAERQPVRWQSTHPHGDEAAR